MRMIIYPIYPTFILKALPVKAVSRIENQFRKSEKRERRIPILMTRELLER
jgi:hypothetical protein